MKRGFIFLEFYLVKDVCNNLRGKIFIKLFMVLIPKVLWGKLDIIFSKLK